MSKTQATFHQDHSTIKLTETQGNNASRRKWIREQSSGNIGSPGSSETPPHGHDNVVIRHGEAVIQWRFQEGARTRAAVGAKMS